MELHARSRHAAEDDAAYESVQVMDILLAFMELKDWAAACEKAVPQRKRTDGKEEGDDRGGKRQKLEGGQQAAGGGAAAASEGVAAAAADAGGGAGGGEAA